MGFWYTPGHLRVLRKVRHFIDKVVANCDAVRRVTIQSERFRSDQVEVIYNGIPMVRPSSTAATLTRADFGIHDNLPLLVLVANLRPLKRIEDAVSTLATLIGQGFAAPRLLIVGEDRPGISSPSYRAELEALAERLGVADRVHFSGKLANPAEAVALADICVLCSETEGLSNVVIEYMLAGKPVVCTDVGGNSEIVVSGLTGHIVPARDVPALSRAIADLLADPAKRKSWGEAGKISAMSRFGHRRMLDDHVRLYKGLAASGRGRSELDSWRTCLVRNQSTPLSSEMKSWRSVGPPMRGIEKALVVREIRPGCATTADS
jgi:glycosyltransferase involved in cell wall biosynthesis